MNMYDEDDLLPLSGLQHLLFCERQCALIHIEQAWKENRFTAEGRILHERADAGGDRNWGFVHVVYSLPLRSLRLGLSGLADVVEFHEERGDDGDVRNLPYPVEYKRGRPKPADWDLVQLCAQAMCIEEMMHCNVPAGAVFYGQPRRRLAVVFDDVLRRKTEAAAFRFHELVRAGVCPPANYSKKCDNCSLLPLCLPKVTGQRRGAVSRYVAAALAPEVDRLVNHKP